MTPLQTHSRAVLPALTGIYAHPCTWDHVELALLCPVLTWPDPGAPAPPLSVSASFSHKTRSENGTS